MRRPRTLGSTTRARPRARLEIPDGRRKNKGMVRSGSNPLRKAARALSSVIAVAGLLVGASCATEGASYRDYSHCDEVVRRCRTVCNYWCDAWGCYPMCYDQCWGDCYVYPDPPPSTTAPPAADGATPPPPPADGGVSPDAGSGSGALCNACASNEDCASGALCIVRGGPRPADAEDAGAPTRSGFCGQACSAPADCPEGFACSQLGSVRQCIPRSGTCE